MGVLPLFNAVKQQQQQSAFVFPWGSAELLCTHACAFANVSVPLCPTVSLWGTCASASVRGLRSLTFWCVRSCTSASACFELAYACGAVMRSLWNLSGFERSFWVVRASSLVLLFVMFTPGFRSFSRWTFLLLCSYEYSSRALYEQQFGGHVGHLPPHLSVFVEVCSSSITSSSSVPTPEVALTPVLLSQHDLTRAFFQALGESLPQLVAALQGHVHSTNSSARESVSSATTALSPSVCCKLESPQV